MFAPPGQIVRPVRYPTHMIMVGVEAGSSAVRTTAFDESGAIVAATARSLVSSSPQPNWFELDQEAVFGAVGQTIRELLPKLPESPELLCLTGPPDGVWLVDPAGKSVRPAILPTDRRAVDYPVEWTAQKIFAAVYRRAGYALTSGSSAASLRWLLDHEPESLLQAATIFSAKDALLHRLTGARVTDISDASVPFLDLRSRTYDEELIDLLRLRPIRHLLPPIDSPSGSLWPMSTVGAELTGLPVGMAVHAGPFDAIAIGLAAGLQGTGDAFVLLGPQLTTGVQIERLELAGEPTGRTVCLPRYDRWVQLLTSGTGMLLLDWLLALLGIDYADLDTILQRTPAGSHGVMMVSPFSVDGETAPQVIPNARGQIVGLTDRTNKDDLARAACESLAFAAKRMIANADLPLGIVTLIGGGSRAPAFRQLLTDILGYPIQIAPQPETAARGAVIAGMIAAGISYDHSVWTAATTRVEPDPATTAFYEERYAEYRGAGK